MSLESMLCSVFGLKKTNNEAVLNQIHYWSTALRQANKAIRRKNNYIRRLQCENQKLHTEISDLHEDLAKATMLPGQKKTV